MIIKLFSKTLFSATDKLLVISPFQEGSFRNFMSSVAYLLLTNLPTHSVFTVCCLQCYRSMETWSC